MNRTPRSLLVAIIAAALLAAGCGASSADSGSVSVSNTGDSAAALDPVVDATVALPDGLFELAGYGTVLRVDGDEVTPFYVTASTCVAGEAFDNELPVDHAGGDGVITLDLVGPTTDYQLRPLQGDLTCDSTEADTVQAVDEVFSTHYPFFAERGVDWDTELAEIQAATDGDGFDESLVAFLIRLGDGHTIVDGLDIAPDIDAFGFDDVETLVELETAVAVDFDATIARIEGLTTDPSGTVGWGQATDGVGSLFIGGFEGLGGDDNPVADRTALTDALDAAIDDLDDRFDRLIIDVRFNQGGYEDLAVVAAGYFVDEPTPAYRKWAHAQPDPAPQTVDIEPQAARFHGEVVVVTSPVTASAAEVFTLAMTEVADATVVGNPSFGEFSDAIDWVLPNGTELTISMEVYTDLNDNNHEATGIPVDVTVPFDEAIDAAVAHLGSPS